MDLKNQILVALGLDKEEILMSFQAKLEDGTIVTSQSDELIAGVDISVLTEDGSVMLLPVGNYELESGESFSVEEEGIVSEVFGAEDVEEEAPVEEEVEMAEEADVADWEGMEKRIANLENAIADLKGEEKDTEEEVEEMSVETEVEERGTTPKSIKTTEVVEFSMEDLKAENDRLKTELAAQPASAPLDTNKFSSEKTSLSKKQIKRMTSQERFFHNLNN